MKKIVLLLPFLFVFCNCSTDDSINNPIDEVPMSVLLRDEGFKEKATAAVSCFTSFTASASVDVSGGLGNPVLVFNPQVTGYISSTEKYMAKLEVQPLLDCDDMSSNTGNVLFFGPPSSMQKANSTPPKIRVQPSSLPQCYKWRYVAEGINSGCISVTAWYETPVY